MAKELKTDERILRDQIIRKSAVDNMTNIAKQREDLKQGIMPSTPIRKSATELAEDRTVQAGDALQNLIDLGFKESEAHEIASTLTQEDRVAFNRAYPQIKTDFESRFNVKNTTPAFFTEYIKKYMKVLKATKGVPSSVAYLQDNIITTPNDLLKLILTSEGMTKLYETLDASYRLDRYGALATTLTELIDNLPNGGVIANLNQVMNIDPVVGFEAIQDILKILKPLPSNKAIEKIMSSTSTTQTQKKRDLLDKLAVLAPTDFAELGNIYTELQQVIDDATISTLPPMGAPMGAPIGAPIGAPPVPIGAPLVAPPTPPPIAVPTPATSVSATLIAPPKNSKRRGLFLLPLNSSTGVIFDVYLFNYNKTYFAVIFEEAPSGSSSSSSSSSSSGSVVYWGLDISDISQFFDHFESQIDSNASGTAFNLSSLKPYTEAGLSKFLKSVNSDPSKYRTKFFSSKEMTDMTYDQYEPQKVGLGLKSKKTKAKVKATNGLKPIRLGKGFEKNDPYRTYDEELNLTPISVGTVITKKPPKPKSHTVTEGVEGNEYEQFDDKANRYIAFGKYAINMRQLKKGVLQIVYKSLAPNPSFPSKKIGSELQQYLFELLTNKKSLPALYKHVSEDEKKMFEKLAIFAGVFDKLNLPRMNSLEDEKKEMDRFKLLHGEFIAGNDNVGIVRELRNLILKFLAENRISKAKAYEYLLELNNA